MLLNIFKRTRLFQGLMFSLLIIAYFGFEAQAQEAKPAEATEVFSKEASGKAAEAEAPTDEQPPADFDLLELRVKGNTLIDSKQVGRAVYPFLGPKKTIDTVESARAALEKLYQSLGYQTVAVDIPEQDVKNGIVYLQVVEGKVSRLRVV